MLSPLSHGELRSVLGDGEACRVLFPTLQGCGIALGGRVPAVVGALESAVRARHSTGPALARSHRNTPSADSIVTTGNSIIRLWSSPLTSQLSCLTVEVSIVVVCSLIGDSRQ